MVEASGPGGLRCSGATTKMSPYSAHFNNKHCAKIFIQSPGLFLPRD